MSSADLRLVTPATVVDMADVFGCADYAAWVGARRQLARGTTYAIRDDRGALVVGGFARDGEWLECWFWATPRASRHMARVVRLVRLTLSERADDRVYAVIRTDAGRRIARALGFSGTHFIGNCEVWTYGKGDFRSLGR